MRLLVLIGMLFLPIGTAQAAWHKASSAHFVVYADDSEAEIRKFSEQLERYHAAMALLLNAAHAQEVPSPSNRVTVYVVRNDREVRKLYGEGSKYLGGFYLPRAGGSLAIVPRIEARTGKVDVSMIVLLHEYAHHITIAGSGMPMPRWLTEGAAEFFSQASFAKDGTVQLGLPAHYRAGEIFFGKDVKAEELLDPETYEAKKRDSYDAFYGKSWLLYHYLTFGEARKGQLDRDVALMTKGKTSREAALEAFGDFNKLDDELDDYLMQRRIKAFTLPPSLVKIGAVAVTRLSEGEASIMPVRIRSRRGVTQEQAAELLPEARAIAARYPDDPEVLAALAEAEYDAGNLGEAVAAADAALLRDPAQVNAYVQKGFALFGMAKNAKDFDAAYREARSPFLALNRI